MTVGPTVGRRAVLRAGASLAVAGPLAAAAGCAAPDAGTAGGGAPLRVGYLPITDASPLLLAHEQGHFTRAGVATARPVLFRSWESLAQAFLTGSLDVVHLLMPFAVQLRYALGARLRVLAWNHTNGSALTVGPGVTRLRDLAGRSVAIPFWWSIHNVMLQQMLRGVGLTPVVRETPSVAAGTVGLVVMSPADMLPALDTGTVGGYIVADPFNAAAEIRRVGRIARFVGDAWRDHACCVVVAREDLLATRPEAAQAVVDGVAAAQGWIAGHRAEAATALSRARYLPQPLPAITRALDQPQPPAIASGAVHHPEWQGQRIGFQPFPFPSYTEALVTAMRGTVVDGDTSFLTDLDPAGVHGELVDDRFVRRTLARLTPAAFGLPPALTRTEEVRPA